MPIEGKSRSDQGSMATPNAGEHRPLDPAAASSLWQAIIDIMPHMISIKDADTRHYVFCNSECDKVLGPNAVGRSNFDVLDQAVAERIEAEETALITSGGVAIAETVVTDRHGACWTMRTKKFVIAEPGERRYLITVSEDVSEKHAQARQLESATEAAEAANAAKSAFLATMSHEIRTPLNGVLGMAQAMAASELPSLQRERLSVIQQSGETLLVILNDILDLSKIEAGKLELEDGVFDLQALLFSVQAPFAALAQQKSIGLTVIVEPSAAGFYGGDPVRVRQILYNLVSNGIKFTRKGGVEVQALRLNDRLIFKVADTGLGISKDSAEVMFEKFTQADTTTTRRFGGTGLGLAICRELCQLMGGSIGIDSDIGRGSTFTVTLPLPWLGESAEQAVQEPASDPPAVMPQTRILAAEDNAINQLVLKTLLEQIGVTPVLVADGVAAVAAWERENWDLILMDVHMPHMDGLEASRSIRLKEIQMGRPRTPIIALTADTMDHQIKSYTDAGMDDHIPKPISALQLFQHLNRVFETKAAAIDGV
jgi:signal transduction histidine kinase